MGILTEKQLEEVWAKRGLKHRMKRFHRFLVERGLLPVSVPEHLFLDHIRNDILESFFVKDITEDSKGRVKYGRSD